jgi:malate synthase
MEDAATAEISRSQLWQWLHHGTEYKDADGNAQTFDQATFDRLLEDEVSKIKTAHGEADFTAGRYPEATKVFVETATGETLADFLTLPAYDVLRTLS